MLRVRNGPRGCQKIAPNPFAPVESVGASSGAVISA
jgi:hypothetical protein